MSVQGWDLFAGIEREEVQRILSMGSKRTVASGSILFELGEEAVDLFLIERGAVRLTLPVTVGGKTSNALVEERLPGQLLGWSAVVPPHRYTLQASASVDTELLCLPRSSFLGLLTDMPSVGSRVFANLAGILGERLQVSQTMWIREMQRVLSNRDA